MEGEVHSFTAPDGATLRCEVAGTGPPLVLLHGSVATRSSFRKLRPFLHDRSRLILTELRGHGGDAPPLPGSYSMAGTEVDDLVAILDGLGEERVRIVGHSTGGTIAVAFARRYPDRVERMALIEPTLLALLDPATSERVRRDLGGVVATGRGGEPLAALAGLLELMGASGWAALPEATRQRTIDALTPLADLTAPHVQALLDFEVTEADMTGLAMPVLLVYGRRSVYFEAPIAARLGALRPDFGQLHVDGAGHNVHAEQPDVVGPAVAEFLGAARL